MLSLAQRIWHGLNSTLLCDASVVYCISEEFDTVRMEHRLKVQ